jgi:cytochrome c551/c552
VALPASALAAAALVSTMRSRLGIGLAALGVALIAAQAIRIDRTNPPVTSDVAAPPAVAALLRRACYDCHSNETVWPWYSTVAPFSWLLARDVKKGRREVNFSTWAAYDAKKKSKKLKESAEEIGEGEMPPWYYVRVHPEARMSPAERELLRAWTAEQIAQLQSATTP